MPSESESGPFGKSSKQSKHSKALGEQKDTLNALKATIETEADAQVKQVYQEQLKKSVILSLVSYMESLDAYFFPDDSTSLRNSRGVPTTGSAWISLPIFV